MTICDARLIEVLRVGYSHSRHGHRWFGSTMHTRSLLCVEGDWIRGALWSSVDSALDEFVAVRRWVLARDAFPGRDLEGCFLQLCSLSASWLP